MAMIESIIEDQLECEMSWQRAVQAATALCSTDRELGSRYVRLNVTVPGRVPRLDQVERVGELEDLVIAKGSDEEKEVAHRLIASCFFSVFQPADPATMGTVSMVLGQPPPQMIITQLLTPATPDAQPSSDAVSTRGASS